MINLAKTPANQDFQSKYYKPNTTTATTKNVAQIPGIDGQQTDDELGVSSLPTSPSPQTVSHQITHRSKTANRSLVRDSKSEDQLAVAESLDEDDDYFGQSCHTLISAKSAAA